MDDSSPVSVEDEVEGRGQSKEAYEVEGFVGLGWDVWLRSCRGGWEGGVRKQAEGGGKDEEDEEGDCRILISIASLRGDNLSDLLAKGKRIRIV